jgi:hypothetical protein
MFVGRKKNPRNVCRARACRRDAIRKKIAICHAGTKIATVEFFLLPKQDDQTKPDISSARNKNKTTIMAITLAESKPKVNMPLYDDWKAALNVRLDNEKFTDVSRIFIWKDLSHVETEEQMAKATESIQTEFWHQVYAENFDCNKFWLGNPMYTVDTKQKNAKGFPAYVTYQAQVRPVRDEELEQFTKSTVASTASLPSHIAHFLCKA